MRTLLGFSGLGALDGLMRHVSGRNSFFTNKCWLDAFQSLRFFCTSSSVLPSKIFLMIHPMHSSRWSLTISGRHKSDLRFLRYTPWFDCQNVSEGLNHVIEDGRHFLRIARWKRELLIVKAYADFAFRRANDEPHEKAEVAPGK